jgi:hypothetical protein
MPLQIDLRPRQSKVEINDLPSGDYDLEIFARPIIKDGAVDITVLAIQPIHIGPGETKKVRF